MVTMLHGDCRGVLKTIKDGSVNCCVTSPPYYGLRNYGVDGQIGLEKTPEEYIETLVSVFREVRRCMKDDGTLWLNIGDSYAGSGRGIGDVVTNNKSNLASREVTGSQKDAGLHENARVNGSIGRAWVKPPVGYKAKDLIGIPWMLAFALRSDGWYLRSDIIWAKPNCMPESVTDRPTRSHEYIFLLSKSAHYYYDQDAIKEPMSVSSVARLSQDIDSQAGSDRGNGGRKTNGTMKAVGDKQRGHSRRHNGFNERWDKMEHDEQCSGMKNKRDVWTVAPACYSEAHFATFPPDLIRPCILAGCPIGGTVIDPFGGSGTTGEVSEQEGRNSILIELNESYIDLQKQRTAQQGFSQFYS